MGKKQVLGVDVGATGIKGGLVDVKKGVMLTERYRLDTPRPATPLAMARTFEDLIARIDYQGPIGVGFPAVVNRNVAGSAANIDESWIGTNIAKVFGERVDLPVFALNDADAAGLATMRFGVGRKYRKHGVVLMITVGTGLGAALFLDGELVPNMELGQLYLRDMDVIAEKFINNRMRKDNNMPFPQFGRMLGQYIAHVDVLFNPDLIVIGGGAAKYFAEYKGYLKAKAEILPAELENTAGTVGAAYYAYRQNK